MRIHRALRSALIGALAVVQCGCGTLLHPERSGQAPGRLDPAIVILDGIGLLFYFIPGLVAFAVDFSNNTIYLPAGRAAATFDTEDARRVVRVDGPIDRATLERVIERETGVARVLGDERLRTHGAGGG